MERRAWSGIDEDSGIRGEGSGSERTLVSVGRCRGLVFGEFQGTSPSDAFLDHRV